MAALDPIPLIRPQGRPGGPDFPDVTVNDWVNSQLALAERLDIDRWAVVIGGSLGGMQALYWAVHHPGRVANCVVLAAAPPTDRAEYCLQ